jgi:hypothetical protein
MSSSSSAGRADKGKVKEGSSANSKDAGSSNSGEKKNDIDKKPEAPGPNDGAPLPPSANPKDAGSSTSGSSASQTKSANPKDAGSSTSGSSASQTKSGSKTTVKKTRKSGPDSEAEKIKPSEWNDRLNAVAVAATLLAGFSFSIWTAALTDIRSKEQSIESNATSSPSPSLQTDEIQLLGVSMMFLVLSALIAIKTIVFGRKNWVRYFWLYFMFQLSWISLFTGTLLLLIYFCIVSTRICGMTCSGPIIGMTVILFAVWMVASFFAFYRFLWVQCEGRKCECIESFGDLLHKAENAKDSKKESC